MQDQMSFDKKQTQMDKNQDPSLEPGSVGS